ncbi:SDR family mycofactocin-dependent oxidoreductase [Geodermatophilus sp. TF02-6]|uniref:mycofactocin-coupled SDR family oxidoreductase n=1 Tax=Geodermatophilus sp. TF02-6 TaxID=2250575 RepID=UPI000DE98C99|nr:mycofactocin-coupled SDR family oxidoreductase [Geodermatophilus sp. TF02-6]RBY83694.1 SDR family mycofactocin-dependent oxidoreductase [Geodermatophilus sp. TF02-6]
MPRLEGKVAFITGAARGQGRSHAVRLAQEGADVIAVDGLTDVASVGYPMATQDDLDETVRQVEALDRRIVASKVDVRDGAGLARAVDDGVAQLGRLDVVLANAGIASFSPAEVMSDQVWDETIDINLSGVFKTVRPAIPHLKRNEDGGAIVLTSSVAGLRGVPNIAHYCAAKFGLVGMMKVLAMELAPHRIRVNTVHPTNVDTTMIQNESTYGVFFPDRDASTVTKEDAAPVFQETNLLPVPWVEPADISEAVLFLVADSGRYVTGAQIPVDAGYSTR